MISSKYQVNGGLEGFKHPVTGGNLIFV